MSFWERFLSELGTVFQQITTLPAWAWIPLYLLGFALLAALAFGVHL